MDSSTKPHEPAKSEMKDEREPWQPLGYDKIAAAQAETTFIGSGSDNTIYS
ncbi:MAG: hypothetical protein ACXWUN_04455 [Allosphingosinicella sp.]